MADIAGATKALEQFKKLISSGSHIKAKEALTDVKLKIVQFQGLPPMLQSTPTRDKELMLARDMLENSVFLAVSVQDGAMFTRNLQQLKPYYSDLRELLPASQHEHTILGLNLLALLAQNRIAEFHVELELLPAAALTSVQVDFPLQLERQLMEGVYEPMYDAAGAAPSPYMKPFVEQLQTTVRNELASSAAAAYDKLLLKDAAALLKFSTQHDLLAFCAAQQWHCDAQHVFFAAAEEKDGAAGNMAVFHNVLTYARELDRII